MFVDRFHKQALDLRDGKGFFRKGVKLGFAQHLCQRCYTLHSGPTGDQSVCPFPAVAFLIVAAAVFKLLLFVPEPGKLALTGGDLIFQFGDGFLFGHGT